MPSKYELIVWDWDGTLMDSTPTIVKCIQQACVDLELPVPDDSVASHVIGLGVQDALRTAVPSVRVDQHPRLVDRFRYHYLSKDHELHLFVGIKDLLNQLKANGHLLAVATGKSRKGLDRSLNFHDLNDMFADTRTPDECFSKPHPAMLIELSESLAVPMEKVLMIGDTTHDLLMAKNAGADAIAVTYGAHPEHVLRKEEPLMCIGQVEELSEWLLTHA
ncbi:HAD-IA family hydrolase [Polynucleobacter sp. MWH-Spelu-300-X4]|uniref:HAD family hydrolase n=1 Tax=Polynucleobacter sp. MWH-Spelu-300-X4 TaxID=2689109 RepID=UPI001BFCE232|nr:HAD-IA family hydrolase [Polynucleobacter sp. MWH-Spelu-300-X4]QWD80274.1 HAD-IA family hydrolase [Polynucleobacter sp. MWH-Spelu-300-X4]